MGIADAWSQREREAAVKRKLMDARAKGMEVKTSYDMAKDRTRFRYIDPDTGQYYDYEIDGDPTAAKTAMEMMQQEEQRQKEKAWRDREDKRDTYARMVKQCAERGDMGEAQYWMEEIEKLFNREGYPDDIYKLPPVENKIKATVHRDGHFPVPWLLEAIDLAEKSDVAITFGIEREGIMVMAMSAGEQYAVRVTDWAAMAAGDENPLLKAVKDVEHKLDVLLKLKDKVA